jgi:putative ABC transport system permease protein
VDIIVRSSVAPETLAEPLRQEVLALDPNLPLFDIRTMKRVVEESFWQNRLFTILYGIFAVVSLSLATVGLYGVVSYSATLRKKEIAVRMSVGADTAQVVYLVAKQAMLPVAAGLSLGLSAALGLTRAISRILVDVSPMDPATFACVGTLMLVVALVSCLIPARRASRMDPIASLRSE